MQKWVFAVLLVLVAGGAWYFLRERPETPPAPAPQPAAAPAPPPQAADVPLPPATDTDAQVRKALSSATTWPVLQKWIAEGDLLSRWAVVADNLAEDVSPRKQLAAAAPAKGFAVLEKKGTTLLDPRSYQRYDIFTEVVASVDAKAFAASVHELHPVLEAAYHKLGYPDRRLDDVAQKALARLVSAPIVEGAIELRPKGALYTFADPKLEALGPVEKHLLRMGPRNTKLIQAKALEIAAELRR
jgi:hypothetical protein